MTAVPVAVEATADVMAAVRVMRIEADGVLSLELARADGGTWPADDPGAHVDIDIPGVGWRPYSRLPSACRTSLGLAVQRDPHSRGGSRWIHEVLRPGQSLRVGPQRNHFQLEPGSGPACLIAGGIGITPLLSMAMALDAAGRDWQLHYAVRTRRRAAFLGPLARFGTRVRLHVDDEVGTLLAMPSVVAEAPRAAHFYACGPAPMLSAFRAATAELDPAQVHVEVFAPPVTAAATGADHAFELELARSGLRCAVPVGRSILDVLLAQGVPVPHSCRSGICGRCETRVLAGTPVHRDLVLSPHEQASGQTMLVCCSRVAGDRLRLDL